MRVRCWGGCLRGPIKAKGNFGCAIHSAPFSDDGECSIPPVHTLRYEQDTQGHLATTRNKACIVPRPRQRCIETNRHPVPTLCVQSQETRLPSSRH